MLPDVINVAEKLATFSDQWSPKIIAQLNDYHFKLAKIEGEFVWHSHDETDEVFFVMDGALVIKFRDGEITLTNGELCVIPKGIEHKPVADKECRILLVEPVGIKTTHESGEMTQAVDIWI